MNHRHYIGIAIFVTLNFTSAPLSAEEVLNDQRCMALAMYWEARGEGRNGKVAVAWTILNRMHSPLFPSTACEVIFEGGEKPPCQFSWWCDGKSDVPTETEAWNKSLLLAKEMLSNPPKDPTRGALFFHAKHQKPPWKIQRYRTARIAGHIFYR